MERTPNPTPTAAASPHGSVLRRLFAACITALLAGSVLVLSAGVADAGDGDLAWDHFNRVVDGGWGAGLRGGEWQIAYANGSFRTTGGVGLVTAAPGESREAVLPDSSGADQSLRFQFDTDVAPGEEFSVMGMLRADASAHYRARARVRADGNLALSLSRRTPDGAVAFLGGEVVVPGVLTSPGNWITVRTEVVGSNPATLRLKAWQTNSVEPDWQLTRTDSAAALADAGNVGVRTYLFDSAAQPRTVAFEALVASTVDGSAPPTTVTTTTTTPPTTTTTPPPPDRVVAPVGGDGAAPVGTTNHPVPQGSTWVAPWGNDAAAGNFHQPLRTLGQAVRHVAPGGTIVLRAGTYHESVEVPYGKAVTIQNANGEVVWLDGSRSITSWTPDGGDWRFDGFTPQFSSVAEANSVEPAAPLAAWPEMVFVDGVEQRQVGQRENVVPGTFMVDRGRDRIFLGTDPAGHDVRVSWLQEALFVNKGHGSVVRGIGIRRYATSVMQQGALKVYADDALVEDVHVIDNATTGLSITGRNDEVRNVTALRNGMIGISSHQPTDLTIRGSLLEANNDEHFADIPKAGGFKTAGARGLLLENNTARGNFANGFWTDLASDDVVVVRNIGSGNDRHAIEIELTGDAIVAGNVVADNKGTGVYINETARAKVWNNTMVDNEWAWQVVDGPRTSSDTEAPGQTENIVLRNNLGAGARGNSQSIIQANDYTRQRTGVGMGAHASDNAYFPPSTGQGPAWFAIWGNYPGHPLIPKTLAELQQATGAEARSFEHRGVDPFRNWAAGDFRLVGGSQALGSGVPIPGDVAAALGISGGTIDRGALLG